MKKLIEIKRRGSNESGFTLLEYCAGAAVIVGIIWASLSALGTNLKGFLGSLSTWVSARNTAVSTADAADGEDKDK